MKRIIALLTICFSLITGTAQAVLHATPGVALPTYSYPQRVIAPRVMRYAHVRTRTVVRTPSYTGVTLPQIIYPRNCCNPPCYPEIRYLITAWDPLTMRIYTGQVSIHAADY